MIYPEAMNLIEGQIQRLSAEIKVIEVQILNKTREKEFKIKIKEELIAAKIALAEIQTND